MKKLTLLISAICMLSLFSGCSNSNSSITNTTIKSNLSFVDSNDKVLLSKDDFTNAIIRTGGSSNNENKFCVYINTTTQGRTKLANVTSELIGKSIKIYLDNELIIECTVQTSISGGACCIKDRLTKEEAQKLCDKVNNGK